MFLFRKPQVARDPRVDSLEAEVVKLQSAMRALQTEQADVHDQIRRYMRRAIAAERAAGVNQEPEGDTDSPNGATPLPSRRLWGARARRQMTAQRLDQAGG